MVKRKRTKKVPPAKPKFNYVSADERREQMGRIIKPMSDTEYRAAIEHFGMNQEESGLWLGISHRQGQRYASGDAEVPGPVRLLLRHMLRHNLKPKDVN